MLKRILVISLVLFLSSFHYVVSAAMKPGEFIVLCYHAVPLKALPGDTFSIPQQKFVEQMEYLRTHGYHPVSFDDILMARKGERALPEKAVLLTFDDGYISYRDFVVPVLEELGYPSLLAIVGNFIEHASPEGLPEPLMNWKQIREVSSRKLVEVVSHSYDLHKGVKYNPQGNEAAAATAVAYNPDTKTYETEEEYSARLEADFIAQKNLFKERLGFAPRAMVWPYGRFNQISVEIAKKTGIISTFTIERGFSGIENLDALDRNMVENTQMEQFISMLKDPLGDKPMIRAMQVDLDLVYDPDMDLMDKNLGKLIDRLVAMDVNTVFLQAFADPEGTGNIKSVYFHNSILPVRADFFSHAAHQMAIRKMMVYAWMPVLSIELPDSELNERLKVRESKDGKVVPGTSWYRRLTPFSTDTAELVRKLYEDLAFHSQIHGILFQDDAYLTDYEDFHPEALNKYAERFGSDVIISDLDKDAGLAEKWARYKTEALIDFTNILKQGVRRYRPVARFARNLYGIVIENPEAESWFAQDYGLFLKNYDQVVVMAYPQMEEVKSPSEWLKTMVGRARVMPQGLEKTVFKIQTYNWKKEEWINDGTVLEEMRDILSSGGSHLAYYPDNYREDRPALNKIKLEMSTKSYPFIP
ncbi:MAG: poly-beta-1,6-N-acetyl-D-glucosamine N-deacetylase PgaB [Nitrospirae bacterium]|nr:poly-beta-1,6-N-acetyl-D-glucosamine N-deacetylase PgaB [Nitrospirota bacterium]